MYKIIDGNINAPNGFESAGVACGVKLSNKTDLALIYSGVECSAAAVFTSNKVQAAPVTVSKKQITSKTSQAIVINSGNANACTGEKGIIDAWEMVNHTANELKINKENVLVASTGIIGYPLQMTKIKKGITDATKIKSSNPSTSAAKAILTTDISIKELAVEINTSYGKVKIGGIAKGSGMIAPNLSLPHATMIGVITSDVEISKSNLSELLSNASDNSFNMISVDGCESTNDCVFALANGISKVNYLDIKKDFDEAFEFICKELAKKIAADGEGATKLIEVNITGAKNIIEAKSVAKKIIQSDLVKSAIFGNDPNWGRIIAAAGSANIELNEEKLTLKLQDNILFKDGSSVKYKKSEISNLMESKSVSIELDLGVGVGKATAWGCDLTYDYVRINAEYST